MYHENGRFVPTPADYSSDYSSPPSVYDAAVGRMPRAFWCSRWAL